MILRLPIFLLPSLLIGFGQLFQPLLSQSTLERYETIENIPYRAEIADAYAQERCVLDLYRPLDSTGYATVVFFHGGGLENGNKFVPEEWRERGIAVVAANYRLHPRVKNPVYTEDAAAAVAWALRNVADYGGDPQRIYVSGHSAGGYLASMIGLDTTYLAVHECHPDSLAGLAPLSGHTITHFTPRRESGLEWNDVVVDKFAPIRHLRPVTPPILLVTGDREMELFGRYEENAFFWRILKASGNDGVTLRELEGFNHVSMLQPATLLVLEMIRSHQR